ncbi:hypothetical protein CERSUDRAFT_113137 [Gelatoporia subvermispora B]|uniref:Reverse transcriptase domain-containing protein n=1 Tax=Ceriporiopsis subvermispora (strain B) TaxID=914234 RepID=M2RGV2_CERS8|nr:hypothetical protein CERSUDRAFT_113137 [Gelatoporia subvermispora B]
MEIIPVNIRVSGQDLKLQRLHDREYRKDYKASDATAMFIVCAPRLSSEPSSKNVRAIPLKLRFARDPHFDAKVPEKQHERRIAALEDDTVTISVVQFSGPLKSEFNTTGWELYLREARVAFAWNRPRIRIRFRLSIGTWSMILPLLNAHWPKDLSVNETNRHALFLVTGSPLSSNFRPSLTVPKAPSSPRPRRTTALLSVDHAPVPSVPKAERDNEAVRATIHSHPDLFSITTPVKVKAFSGYLARHPNQRFVQSVCTALKEGFWPWADTQSGNPAYPAIWDEARSRRGPRSDAIAQFLRDQRDEEVKLGRFSKGFDKLLPGMYVMPVNARPKPEAGKFRMITDHSSGRYALNNMVAQDAIKDITALDDLAALFEALRQFKRKDPKARLVLWKSDVSQAYRRLPMAPEWQIKQVVKIDSQYHVDRCNCFGNKASMAVWMSFMSLVVWIAINVKKIDHFNYVDDVFGFQVQGKVEYYKPYKAYFPKNQARLLKLWDELGIPHDQKKQLHGSELTILGLSVDPNAMIVSLSPEGKESLEKEMSKFCDPEFRDRSRSLVECQQLIGRINWAFQVFPLLRPALNTLFAQMDGLEKPSDVLTLDARVAADFSWLLHHLSHLRGRRFDSDEWTTANLAKNDKLSQIAFVHASPPAVGVYFPWVHVGYFCDLSPAFVERDTVFWNTLAIWCAVHAACCRVPQHSIRRLSIYSDNTQALAIFRSLRSKPEYCHILKSGVDIMIKHDVDVRVEHVLEKENIVAEAISRRHVDLARMLDPRIEIKHLDPPRDALVCF